MKQEDITEKIIAMEKAALAQWNKGNPTGFLEILADDITYFDPVSERRIDGYKRMEELYEGLRGGVAVDKSEMINPVVQATESMAVLTYNLLSYSGDMLFPWNCTEVYRKEADGEWKIIHNHWSIIRPMDGKVKFPE